MKEDKENQLPEGITPAMIAEAKVKHGADKIRIIELPVDEEATAYKSVLACVPSRTVIGQYRRYADLNEGSAYGLSLGWVEVFEYYPAYIVSLGYLILTLHMGVPLCMRFLDVRWKTNEMIFIDFICEYRNRPCVYRAAINEVILSDRIKIRNMAILTII